MPFEHHLLWKPRSLHSWVPEGYNSQRQLYNQRALQLKHIHGLSEKEAYIACAGSSGLSRLLVWYTSRDALLRKGAGGHSFVSPCASPSLLIIFQKAAYILVCALSFSAATREHLCIAWLRRPRWLTLMGPTELQPEKTAILRAQQEVTDPGAQSSCERV